jgi:hypothetical protein
MNRSSQSNELLDKLIRDFRTSSDPVDRGVYASVENAYNDVQEKYRISEDLTNLKARDLVRGWLGGTHALPISIDTGLPPRYEEKQEIITYFLEQIARIILSNVTYDERSVLILAFRQDCLHTLKMILWFDQLNSELERRLGKYPSSRILFEAFSHFSEAFPINYRPPSSFRHPGEADWQRARMRHERLFYEKIDEFLKATTRGLRHRTKVPQELYDLKKELRFSAEELDPYNYSDAAFLFCEELHRIRLLPLNPIERQQELLVSALRGKLAFTWSKVIEDRIDTIRRNATKRRAALKAHSIASRRQKEIQFLTIPESNLSEARDAICSTIDAERDYINKLLRSEFGADVLKLRFVHRKQKDIANALGVSVRTVRTIDRAIEENIQTLKVLVASKH